MGLLFECSQAGAQSRAQLHFVTSSSPSDTGTRSSILTPAVSQFLNLSLPLSNCPQDHFASRFLLLPGWHCPSPPPRPCLSGAASARCRRQDLPLSSQRQGLAFYTLFLLQAARESCKLCKLIVRWMQRERQQEPGGGKGTSRRGGNGSQRLTETALCQRSCSCEGHPN